VMECADDDPDANDPYFFVIDFGCGPTNFRSRRDGLSSNSEAASPLQHEMQKQILDVEVTRERNFRYQIISQSHTYVINILISCFVKEIPRRDVR